MNTEFHSVAARSANAFDQDQLKMCIRDRDGYVVKLELPELKELVSLMRRSSNNLNQLTRKVHETGRVYDADLELSLIHI